jgi:hypothetical protein
MLNGAENRGARGAETNGARDDSAAAWSPGPAKAPGEPAEAFLLRRASEYPAPAQVASLGLLGPALGLDGLAPDFMSAAEDALRAADEREALALWSAPFGRVPLPMPAIARRMLMVGIRFMVSSPLSDIAAPAGFEPAMAMHKHARCMASEKKEERATCTQ